MGANMPYLGSIPRYFKSKEPQYYDQVVHEYIVSRGEDPMGYREYMVVPKRLPDSYRSAKRYDRPSDPLTDEIKKMYVVAFDWLEREFAPAISGSRVMSYDEILEWLDPKKSPGLPWTQKYPFKGDYWMSDHCEFYVKYWDVLSTPDYIKSLCSVSIKEEVRPTAKVDVGNIRTVVAMDTNHVQAHLQLYLHQNQRLVDTCGVDVNGVVHSMALGLNLLGGGADLMIGRMSKFGPRSVKALDGVKFDARKRSFQIRMVGDFRFRMLSAEYRNEANRVRSKNLYEELATAPLVMPDGHVFGRDGGNPSGQGCTTPDNGFMNYTDMAVIYQQLVPAEYHNYESWKKFVQLIICGDDINIAVDKVLQPFFANDKIRIAADKIGMEYTFESEDFIDAQDCSFLGHTFRLSKVPGLPWDMYLPCIDCQRMRTNMLVDNKEQTMAMTVIRACGLRSETFGCESCREWFSSLITFLRDRTAKDNSPEMVTAWKSYLPDSSLWKLYTGRVCDENRKYAQACYEPLQPVACPGESRSCEFRSKYLILYALLYYFSYLLFVYYIMPRTAAQRAARRARKKAKKAVKQAQRPAQVKMVVNTVKPKRKRRNRGQSFMSPVTDGLNRSMAVQNRGMVEQKFGIRREKVADVVGSTAFTLAQSLYVNPGNSVLFPIFSQEAAVYEQYRCNHLRFYWTTQEYTANSTNIGAGKIIMATNFDPDDGVFTSKNQMENYWASTGAAPYTKALVHDVLPFHKTARGSTRDATLNNYYVYSSGNTASPVSGATKFYDMGLFQLATVQNVSSADVIGELWVEYSFTMIHPKQQTPLNQQLLGAHIRAASATAAAATPLGTSQTQLSGTNLPITTTSTTIVFGANAPAGRYLFTGAWIAASITAAPSSTEGSAFTAVPWFNGGASNDNNLFIATQAGYTGLYDYVPDPTAANRTITIGGLTTMAAGQGDIIIQQISSGMSQPVSDHEEIYDLREQYDDLLERLSRLEGSLSPLITTSIREDCKEDEAYEAIHRSVPKFPCIKRC